MPMANVSFLLALCKHPLSHMLCAFPTTHRSLMLISEASRDHDEVFF